MKVIQKIDGKLKILSLLLLFVFIQIISLGATLTVDTTKTRVGVPLKIMVNFTNEKKQEYKIIGIENFQNMNKSSQQKSSWINGKSTKSYSDIYTVLPLNEGDFILNLEIDGKKVSNDININVSKDNKEIENSLVTTKNSEYKRKYFIGEKIPYFEKIITKISLNNYGYINPPTFKDFTFKDMTPNNQGNPLVKRISDQDGEKLEILVREGILEANSIGEKNIVSGLIGYNEASANDFFMMSGSEPKYTGGDEISIKILPLPEEGKPQDFQNILGDLKGDINWENKLTVDVGQTFVLKLRLYGEVNLDSLEKLPVEENEKFNIFQSVTDFSKKINNGKYESSKEFEIAFIPKKSGTFSTPEIKVNYFDVKDRKYKTFIVPSKKIKAIGGQNITVQSNNTLDNKSKVDNTTENKITPKEKNIIKISAIPEEKENKDYLIWISGVLGVIVIIQGGIIIKLLIDKKAPEKRNYKDLIKKMKNAKDNKSFYEIYCEFMKERYNFSPKAQFEDILIKNGGSDEVLEINRCIQKKLFKNEKIDYLKVINILKKL
ncbi:BatD family protein [Fusobacterium perfoetens]|uniref:BatD family protein n=1 Tax=Fusobacterium perfoetens TaxID=852 RepID=UPI001F2EBAFD|nr:BatD family protein [Fusobacterium perfoetens]MCF2612740.1 BatD family protein [Fusobacterium perfoetens]